MDGYWKSPELTAERLRTDIIPGERVYRTGDLVRSIGDDGLVWLDRLDNVVSRRGLRTSLAEVTNAISVLDRVEAARVVSRKQGPDAQLVAFVVSNGLGTAEIRRALLRVLPEEMLPDRIVLADDLPVTSSGKIDEMSLLRAAGMEP